METVKDKIERIKETAEILLKNNVRAFVKDTSDNLYFCDILLVGEDSICILCFAPPQRVGKKFTLYYPLILELKDYNDSIREDKHG